MKAYEYTSKLTTQNDLLKKINAKRILGLLRYHGMLTRQDIAEKTGLHVSTVGLIERELRNSSNDLGQLSLIREVENRDGKKSGSQGGRPKIILELNPEGAFFLGFAIGDNTISAVELNLAGKTTAQISKEFRAHDYPKDEVVDPAIIVQMICELREEIWQKKDNKLLQGIGVAVPGNVNEGIVLRAPRLGWKGVNIRNYLVEELKKEFEKEIKQEMVEKFEKEINRGFTEQLERELKEGLENYKQLLENFQEKFPLFIENDARVGAWAEMFDETEEPVQSLLYLFLDEGLGAGMIADRRLFQGAEGMACEVAELIIDTSQALEEVIEECQGQTEELINKLRECQSQTFENLCSEGSLLKAYQKRSGKSSDEIKAELNSNRIDTAHLLSKLLEEKDVAAQEVVRKWGAYLSSGTRQLVRLFNPERVVFGGRLSLLIDDVKEQLNKELEACLPNGTGYGFSNARFSLAVSALKKRSGSTEDSAAIGAAILAHQSLIETPNLLNLQQETTSGNLNLA